MSNEQIYLFLDVDGVIIRGEGVDPSIRRPWDNTLQTQFSIDPQKLSALFFIEHFTNLLKGQGDLKTILGDVLSRLGYAGSVDDIIQCWFSSDANLDFELLEGVNNLKQTVGVKAFLATNQEKYRAEYIWEELGLIGYFDGIFCSASIGAMKTDIAFYEHIHSALGISPEATTILFFDDSEKNIVAARNVGWKAYHYKSIADFKENTLVQKLVGESTIKIVDGQKSITNSYGLAGLGSDG